jgi:dTDP-4-dehydrorhamnose reductase
MRFIITGASGILGSELFSILTKNNFEVQKLDRNIVLSFKNNLEDILRNYDYLIHAAANTNVEDCEIDIFNCYKDNTLLTERLAFAASKTNCKIIYISSTGIYGNHKTNEPYNEYDAIRPTTHHHMSKWLGELEVLKFNPSALILRTGWLFGGNPKNVKNFVARRIEEVLLENKFQVFSNSQQIGVPTYVNDFGKKMLELIQNDEIGIFNLVNSGNASRFEYVKSIFEFSDVKVDLIEVDSSKFNRIAKVSLNESAISLKLIQLGYDPLPNWDESLHLYIKSELTDWIERIRNV